MTKNRNIRNSNIEWLRIVAIVYIIASHFSYHSSFPIGQIPFSVNKSWLLFLCCGGTFGVNLFIIIACYFPNKRIKTEKILLVWETMLFYSIVSCVIWCALNGFDLKRAVVSLFPFTFSYQWWFATSYLIFLLISPLLHLLVESMDRKQHFYVVMGILVLYFFIPSMLLDQTQYLGCLGNISRFITLYFIVQYCKKYKNAVFEKNYLHLVTAAVFLVIIVVLNLITSYVASFVGLNGRYNVGNNIFLLFSTLFLFLWAVNAKPRQNKAVNMIAGTAFSIYLFHDNEAVRWILWHDMSNICRMDGVFFIMKSVAVVLLVFAVGVIVESLRKLIFEKPLAKANQALANGLEHRISAFLNALYNRTET